jgi:hypothetical protein
MDGEHLYVNSTRCCWCCWQLVVYRPESVIPGLPSSSASVRISKRAGRFAHVEKAYANWVCPSLSCLLAMLRSRGCDINSHTYVAQLTQASYSRATQLPAMLACFCCWSCCCSYPPASGIRVSAQPCQPGRRSLCEGSAGVERLKRCMQAARASIKARQGRPGRAPPGS